jgi:hypothetical protein
LIPSSPRLHFPPSPLSHSCLLCRSQGKWKIW